MPTGYSVTSKRPPRVGVRPAALGVPPPGVEVGDVGVAHLPVAGLVTGPVASPGTARGAPARARRPPRTAPAPRAPATTTGGVGRAVPRGRRSPRSSCVRADRPAWARRSLFGVRARRRLRRLRRRVRRRLGSSGPGGSGLRRRPAGPRPRVLGPAGLGLVRLAPASSACPGFFFGSGAGFGGGGVYGAWPSAGASPSTNAGGGKSSTSTPSINAVITEVQVEAG